MDPPIAFLYKLQYMIFTRWIANSDQDNASLYNEGHNYKIHYFFLRMRNFGDKVRNMSIFKIWFFGIYIILPMLPIWAWWRNRCFLNENRGRVIENIYKKLQDLRNLIRLEISNITFKKNSHSVQLLPPGRLMAIWI